MSYSGIPYTAPLTGDAPLPSETIQSFQRAMGEIQGLPARVQLLHGLMQQAGPASQAAPSPWGSMANAGSAVLNAMTAKNLADRYGTDLGNRAAELAPNQAVASYGQPGAAGVPGGVQAPAVGASTIVTAPTPQLPAPRSLIGSLLSGVSR